MKMKVMEHGPFNCLVYKGVIESLDEIPSEYQKNIVEEETGITVYISPRKKA